jgi:hypothetical protein
MVHRSEAVVGELHRWCKGEHLAEHGVELDEAGLTVADASAERLPAR